MRNMTVIEHEKNLGLARSIIYGVTQLCREHGSVIVIEDDLIVAPYFLTYMNLALKCFADRSEVMHISGYMYPVELESSTDALFLPFISSWGWATWQRAWQHFDPYMSSFDKLAGDAHLRRKFDLEGAYPFFRTIRRQREGKIDSWAIRWYLSVFMRQGVALYPTRSLVRNEGLDGSGTHWKARETALTGPLCMAPLTRLPETTTVDEQAYRRVVSFLRRYNHPLRKAWRRLRATVHLPAIQ
ncbi:MAG TPA: hypothetical protein VNK95_18885 [Caldilineaceae bacterium]|nr:hypothetical protein [Caldilineaceae bacterium]